ncbi:retinol-binding protein 3 isoform X1 [Anguilla anguilla]|uniref:retinol-binding protein 3 isoform X1 n=1 Tax=Anguilla anguilla TaxID=7936 RepID=UPI0015AA61AD|nr:retinol-binding protein 3 isoform X1 [Anguilla anguilla]
MPGTLIALATLVFFSHLFPIATSFQPDLVRDMAKVLQENYCFPENLVGMQEAIQQAISSGEILHISDRRTLAAMLTTGVQGALNDPRLSITYEPDYIPVAPSALPPLPPEQLFSAIQSSIKAEVLEGNVGYLRIDRVIGKDIAEKIGPLLLDAIWDRVVHTSSLILDLRYCARGEMSGIPYIVSYLMDAEPPIHLDTVYDRPFNTTTELWTRPTVVGERYGKGKDVMVLTSKGTMGVSEGLAYALKHLKRAIIVGERSAGGSVKIEKLRIGESDFYMTVPVARAISPVTGRSWEVGGVLPNVRLHAKEAVDRAISLIEIRRAIPKIIQNVTDIIKSFYSFTDKVPTILQHLSSIDLFEIISEEDLASKLNYELQTVSNDPRLIVKVPAEPPVIIEEASEPGKIPNNTSFLEVLVDNLFQVTVLPGNTGYLRFDEFGEASMLARLGEQIVKKVWDPIKDTDNLVIDLRFNMGGSSAAVPILLSYLFDSTPAVHFFTIYNRISNSTTEFHTLPNLLDTPYGSRRGVYVLTSHHTATAGEEFAYLMQTLHRATVIGEITSGTLLHSKSLQVEDTNIVVTVPFINFINNNGECWLGGGVVPDAIVLAEEALEKAYEVIKFHQEIHSLVEGTGELLEVHYAIPEVAAKVRKVLMSKWAEGLYRSVVDYESLASQLTADLQEMTGDHRLGIFYCDAGPESFQEVPKIPTPEEVQHVVDAIFRVEVLPGNVGYLRFDMMADAEVLKAVSPQLLDLVWNKLVSTDALIVDMRYNTDGNSTAVPLLCTYFFNTKPLRHLYTVFDRSTTTMTDVTTLPEVLGQRYGTKKDVYILTSHMTGSAAEVFTRTMKDLNRALVIGEPTTGGSLSSVIYRIGKSILYASIPNRVVLSAVTGKVWSVSGVEPHIAAQANDALNVAQKIIALRSQIPAVVQAAAGLVAENYAFAQIGEDVAGKLKGLLEKGHYGMVNSEEELKAKLSADLIELSGDKNLKTAGNTLAMLPLENPTPEMLADLIKLSFHTDVLENNIGYLRFDMFGDFDQVAAVAQIIVEHIWSKIVHTDALVLDLRYNIGGPTSSIAGFCSYFFDADKQILLDKLYNRRTDAISEMWTLPDLTGPRYGLKKSLIILTSEVTSGAAEEFVYIMKKVGRAMIVGEVTNGGSHPPEKFRVGKTDVFLSIPVIHSDTAQGPAWEGAGISPHIPVPADSALDKAKEILSTHLAGRK